MTTKITVIGSGSGGHTAAIRAAQLGAEVTLIEEKEVGGVCLNRGCIPTKALIASTSLIDKFRSASDFGVTIKGEIQPDLKKMQARKEKIVTASRKALSDLLERQRITLVNGKAIISGPGKVQVNCSDGKEKQISWDKLILSTGSGPAMIPGFSFGGSNILTSDEALKLEDIPDSILIVGAGAIGCEWAFIFSSLGSRVTLVEAMSRILPLPGVDEMCSTVLAREMKKKGINLLLNHTVQEGRLEKGILNVTLGPRESKEGRIPNGRSAINQEAEKMLVCIGRKPNTTGLGLENVKIETDKYGWIRVDKKMETSVQGIYTIGDALGPEKIMLAHAAMAEGRVAAENALGFERTMDYSSVPGAIFTSPPVADVGMTETEALQKGWRVQAETCLFRSLGKAQADGKTAGQAKVVFDRKNRRLLGLHLIGPQSPELIGEGVLALNNACTVEDLAETVHPHPTLNEIISEVSRKALYTETTKVTN